MQVRLKVPQRHRAVLIDACADREAFLDGLLLDRGIVVVARYRALSEVSLQTHPPEADIAIVYVRGELGPSARDLSAASRQLKRPVLVITETDDPLQVTSALEHGADAVLSVGASTDRLTVACATAMAQFERAEGLRARAERAERDLETRKLVERAKVILMRQRSIGEADAHRELQRLSMVRNAPLREVARTVIAAKELLG